MPSRQRCASERKIHSILLSRPAYNRIKLFYNHWFCHLIFDLHCAVNTCGAKKVGKSIASTGRETSVLVITSGDWQTCRSICETTIDCVGWVLVDRDCTQKLKGQSKARFSPASSTSISAICTPSHLTNPGSDPG